jgi:putative membrane protein
MDANELALERTLLAAERTLLAWTRTALSMIGFGFTMYKFFQYLREAHELYREHAPRNLGLTLIALGTLTLVAAAFQHRRTLVRLGATTGAGRGTMAVGVTLALALVGALVFASIYLGTGPF